MSDFDYIVVGSGSAGSVLAARLSEDPSINVLLVEAGPSANSSLLRIPAAARYAFNAKRFNWNYKTEPETFLNGRTLFQPRGKVLGGSSSINGLVYLRGHALDYEAWETAGATGWGYSHVLPYFQRLETRRGTTSLYCGNDGPVHVSTPELINPIAEAFLEAGQQAGYVITDDINGFQQEGFGRFPMNAADGYRWSTARAYLVPARQRRNLATWTGCHATNILVSSGRATALRIRKCGRNRTLTVTANREIILSAGAFNSPQLLMLSGIGPATELRKVGIETVQDLPGVGENLQDHAISSVQLEATAPVSLARHLSSAGKAKALIQWLAHRNGPLASNHFECGAFVRSATGVKYPDLQFYLFPVAVDEGSKDFHAGHGFQVQISPQRSESMGRVRLRSSDPTAPPRILLNLMSRKQDWIEMRAALRLAREVLAQPAMDRFRGREMSPGKDVNTDEEIDTFMRAHAQSSYHASGTCKMGTDEMAVVDSECKVRGIDGLRVVDCSIMPSIPSCNLNAPAMMIGERAADLIVGKSLPESELKWYVDEHWQGRQRLGTPVRRLD